MFDSVRRRLAPFALEFSNNGKQIYLVGGAIRNLLLGRVVKDFDFTTDAKPEEVQELFPKVLPTGIRHGTVTVLFQGNFYEVTTFRIDGQYSDKRRPDAVTFTPSLEEDLSRRDFTINSIALNLIDGRLVDPHDGAGDIKRRLLKAIGEPGKRFDEDALRLLRLFRFASQLDFSIDPETLAAASSRCNNLVQISKERIREELFKAMAGERPDLAWGPLSDLGILGILFPDLNPKPLSQAGLEQLVSLKGDLRWSFWLTIACRFSETDWESSLKRLTFSNTDITTFLGPTKAWNLLQRPLPVSIKAKAIIAAWGSRERVEQGNVYLGALEAMEFWSDGEGLRKELLRASQSLEPIFLHDLAVSGKTLQDAGLKPGPTMGKILRNMQEAVWANPQINSEGSLLELAQSLQ